MRTIEIRQMIAELLERAAHARTLGTFVLDHQAQRDIAEYAEGLERKAAELEETAAVRPARSSGKGDDPA